MARLVKAVCPQCGAGVQLDPAHDWVTCSYCRTSSFIRKASRQAPPPNVPGQYQVIDLSAATRAASKAVITWTVVAGAIAVLGAVIPMAVGLLGAAGSVAKIASVTAPSVMVGDRAMLGDATGDEALDPIVPSWIHGQGKSRKVLVALDAHSGKVMWTSEALSDTSESLVLGAVGRTALVAEAITLSGWDLRSGRRLWQQPLPEKVEMFCDDGQGGAAFVAKDDQVHAIELATGRLTNKGKLREQRDPPYTPQQLASFPAKVRPRFQKTVDDWNRAQAAAVPCAPASSPDYWSRGAGVVQLRTRRPEIEGFSVDEVWRQREQGPLVVLGSRASGSRIPMVAVVGETDQLLWKAELPSKNPLGAAEGEPETFTVGHGRVITAYHQKAEKLLMVSSWALDGGQRHWEVAIPADSVSWPGIALTDRHVFVRNGQGLYAFALSDGRALWNIGKPG